MRGEPYNIKHRIIVHGNVKWVGERDELEFDEDGALKSGFGAAQEIRDLVELKLKVLDYTCFSAKDCASNEIGG